MSDGSMDGALRAAFEPGESVIARLQRSTGVKPRILLHDSPDEESPLLRVGGAGGPGAEDDSRYRIVGEIARGGVGVIYKARDRDLGRDVALKVLRREHGANPPVLERLVEEAQIGGQLQHPGIVPVYGLSLQADGRPCFAMKLVKGRTLAASLAERGDPLRDLPRLLRVYEQICQTIAYAHARGVVHRDLKPGNVMVGGFGEVLVVDWGFGKVLGRRDPMAERSADRTVVATVRSRGEGSDSVAGSVMGTPAYMPPEQALGQVETLDERCDVFALGAILCEILTGRPPYVGAPEDLLVMAAQARLEDAHARLASCKADPALVDLCRRALAPMRADRPKDASAVARALDGFLSAADARAREAEVRAVRERARLAREREEARWARRAKRRTAAVAAAAVAAVVLACAGWLWREESRRAHAAAIRPEAEGALEEATRLLGAERWAEAASEARRAGDLAGQTELLATIAEEAARRAAEAGARADRATRRAELVAALEDARMRRGDESTNVVTDDRYAAAFARAGLDLGRGAPDVAARIRAEYSDATETVAATLDEWAWLRRTKPELLGRDAGILDAIAREIDPQNNDARDAMASGDIARLRAAAEGDPTGRLRTLDLIATCLHDAGDPAAAVALSRRLRAAHPSDFWVHYRGGLHAARVPGGDREALECMTAAVALRPGSAWARAALGLYLARVNDVDGALEACREATRLNPTLVHVHLDTAKVLAQTNLAAATEVCEEAIRQRPDHVPAHNALAQVLIRRGDYDAAVAACREAIRLDPGYGPPYSNLGMALAAQRRIDDAIAAFREAIRLEPDLDEPHNNLAVSLFREKHDPDGAIAVCREAIRLKHDRPDAHGTLGIALSEKGDHAGAIAACREAVRLRPMEARRLVLLGLVLDRAGDLDAAIDATREAVRKDPECVDAYVPLGVRLGRLGDLEGAAGAFRAAIRLQPRLAVAYASLGFVLANLGDFDGAVAASERAVELAPGLPAAHYSLGVALASKEERDRAITALREAIRLEPSHTHALLELGQALLLAGRFEEALDCRRKLHEIGSRRPDWTVPSGAWVAQAERLVAMERRIPEFLSREAKPRDVAEAIDLATTCRCKGLYPEAAGFVEDALARDPSLATIQTGDALFEAAGTLSRAAADFPGEDSRRWRRLALGCLRARLKSHAEPFEPLTVSHGMRAWKRVPDLAGVRDRIDDLPEPEREEWRKLWADVDALLARAKEALRR